MRIIENIPKISLYILAIFILLSPALAWNITSFEQGTCHNTSISTGETFGVNLIGNQNSYWNDLTINITGYPSPTYNGGNDNFETGTISAQWETFFNDASTYANITINTSAGEGYGLHHGNISTSFAVPTNTLNLSINEDNLSAINVSFYFQWYDTINSGIHWTIANDEESNSQFGYDMYWTGNILYAYDGGSPSLAVCAWNGTNAYIQKLTVEINLTNATAKYYCNDDYRTTYSQRGTLTGGLNRLKLASTNAAESGVLSIDNITILSLIKPTYPYNLSLNLNNTEEAYHNTTEFNGSTEITMPNNYLNEYFSQDNNLSLWYSSTTAGYIYTCLMRAEYNNYINLSIIDEDTLTLINENITIEISQDNTSNYYWTTNGTLFLFGNYTGDYTIGAYNNNYAKRIYAINIPNNESQNLTVYLGNRSNSVTFIIKNKITGDNLEGAIVNQYRYIDGINTLVSSVFSDINGQAHFTYATGIRYFFTITLDGYLTKEFTLDPIESDEYTILMEPTGLTGSDTDWYGVTPYISTTTFINNTLNNLTIGLSSPGEFLENYNITITYPGGTQTHAGSTSTGENFITTFTITGALINDSVEITYQYAHSLGSTREYKYHYLIETADAGTMLGLKRGDYGIGLLERVLIMIFLSIIVGGAIAGFTGSREGGVVVSFLVQGIIAYLLNISVLFIFPSILAGLLIISRRTT